MSGKSQTTKNELNSRLRWDADYALAQGKGVYENLQSTPLPSQYVGIDPARQQGLQSIYGQAAGGSMVPQAFLPEYQKVMSGGYLDAASNPYLQDIVNRSVQAAGVAPTSGAVGGNRFGSGIYANALADARAATAANLYGSQYEAERQRMMQMAGMTPMAEGLQYADASRMMDVGRQYEADQAAQQAEELRQYMFPTQAADWYQNFIRGSPLMAQTKSETHTPFDWGSAIAGMFQPSINLGGGGGGKS